MCYVIEIKTDDNIACLLLFKLILNNISVFLYIINVYYHDINLVYITFQARNFRFKCGLVYVAEAG
jgi:hypothetical protein